MLSSAFIVRFAVHSLLHSRAITVLLTYKMSQSTSSFTFWSEHPIFTSPTRSLQHDLLLWVVQFTPFLDFLPVLFVILTLFCLPVLSVVQRERTKRITIHLRTVVSVKLLPPRSVCQIKVPRFSNRISAYALSSVHFSTYSFVNLPLWKYAEGKCRHLCIFYVHKLFLAQWSLPNERLQSSFGSFQFPPPSGHFLSLGFLSRWFCIR